MRRTGMYLGMAIFIATVVLSGAQAQLRLGEPERIGQMTGFRTAYTMVTVWDGGNKTVLIEFLPIWPNWGVDPIQGRIFFGIPVKESKEAPVTITGLPRKWYPPFHYIQKWSGEVLVSFPNEGEFWSPNGVNFFPYSPNRPPALRYALTDSGQVLALTEKGLYIELLGGAWMPIWESPGHISPANALTVDDIGRVYFSAYVEGAKPEGGRQIFFHGHVLVPNTEGGYELVSYPAWNYVERGPEGSLWALRDIPSGKGSSERKFLISWDLGRTWGEVESPLPVPVYGFTYTYYGMLVWGKGDEGSYVGLYDAYTESWSIQGFPKESPWYSPTIPPSIGGLEETGMPVVGVPGGIIVNCGGIATWYIPVLEPWEILQGDVDGDGQITMEDVIFILNIVVGKEKIDYLPEADVDQDGLITLTDVVLALRLSLGLKIE